MKFGTLYHISPSKNRESIRKNGLIPRGRSGRFVSHGPAVFLFSDPEKPPFEIAGGLDSDVWRVDCSKIKEIKRDGRQEWKSGGSWFYTTESVPPSSVRMFREAI